MFSPRERRFLAAAVFGSMHGEHAPNRRGFALFRFFSASFLSVLLSFPSSFDLLSVFRLSSLFFLSFSILRRPLRTSTARERWNSFSVCGDRENCGLLSFYIDAPASSRRGRGQNCLVSLRNSQFSVQINLYFGPYAVLLSFVDVEMSYFPKQTSIYFSCTERHNICRIATEHYFS